MVCLSERASRAVAEHRHCGGLRRDRCEEGAREGQGKPRWLLGWDEGCAQISGSGLSSEAVQRGSPPATSHSMSRGGEGCI